jgi:hypothetical protein
LILRLELPRLAAAMDHGKVVKWHRQPGEKFAYGDILCEIAVTEVDRLQRPLSGRQALGTRQPKVKKNRVRTMSGILVIYVLTSMETGTIGKIVAGEGDEVRQGDLLALLDTGDEHGTGNASSPARVVVNLARDLVRDEGSRS